MAVTLSRTREYSPLHRARAFDRAPNSQEASSLLAELATAPCRFAPAATDRPLALYGAGNLGRLARDFLKVVGRDFALVIDRDARRMANDAGLVRCAAAYIRMT